MDDALCNIVVDLLKGKPEIFDPLNSAVRIEEENEDEGWKGFQWFDLPAKPRLLKSLVLQKILKIRWKTQSRTCYRLADIDAVKEALKLTTIMMLDISDNGIETEDVPIDLFDDIFGYEDVKQIFFKTLFGEKEDRVHFWMNGPPASAKTLFLFCLERLPRAKYVMGSRTSKAGLSDYLFEFEPAYLLVDEIDKMEHADYAILLGLCETGRVTETIHGKNREVQMDTIVFASSNRLRGIPGEVKSRFQILHFNEYSRSEFMHVVIHVLTRRQINLGLAEYIGHQVAFVLGSKDVRQALRVAKLAKTRRQVDDIIRTLYKYRRLEGEK